MKYAIMYSSPKSDASGIPYGIVLFYSAQFAGLKTANIEEATLFDSESEAVAAIEESQIRGTAAIIRVVRN